MPLVYICSCKSSMYMQLVSISFEFQLPTDKCSSLSSPRLFTVSHTHGNVSDNAQIVGRHPSYTELSYENSLDIERSWRSLWKYLSRILNSSSPLRFCLLCSYFGLLFLPLLPCSCALSVLFQHPLQIPFQTRSVEIAKSTPNCPIAKMVLSAWSLPFDRNIKSEQLIVQCK